METFCASSNLTQIEMADVPNRVKFDRAQNVSDEKPLRPGRPASARKCTNGCSHAFRATNSALSAAATRQQRDAGRPNAE